MEHGWSWDRIRIVIPPWLTLASGLVVLVGSGLIALDFMHSGAILWGVGIAIAVPTMLMAHPVLADVTPTILAARKRRLRITSVLLQLLIAVAVLSLIGALLSRVGAYTLGFSGETVRAVQALLIAGLWVAASYSQFLALGLGDPRHTGNRGIATAITQGALLLGAGALFLALVGPQAEVGLDRADAPGFFVLSFMLLGMAVQSLRGLPTIMTLMRAVPEDEVGGAFELTRKKVVFMPIIAAFTLLFAFLILVVVFGAGLEGLLAEVRRSPVLLVLFLIVLVALAGGVFLAWRLNQADEEPELFRPFVSKREKKETALLIGSLAAAAFIGLLALLAAQGNLGIPSSNWIDIASIGALVALGPNGFYLARKSKRIRLMEERFPDFLRDVASSHRGGLTLTQAVTVAARGDYGPLNPEIRKMVDQITWNTPFEEAFHRFATRVATPLVQRSVSLILEAGRSGGSTVDVLLAAARDAREIKTLERERRLNMGIYTLVIYVTFFVFLFVIGIMYGRFVPGILEASQAAQDIGTTGLDAFNVVGVTHAQYRTFYFMAGVVQAIGNGILAGVMATGSAKNGLIHAFWMVVFAFLTFAFLLA